MARTAKQQAAQRAATAASVAKRKGKPGLKGTPVSRAKATPRSQRTETQRNKLLGLADEYSSPKKRRSLRKTSLKMRYPDGAPNRRAAAKKAK